MTGGNDGISFATQGDLFGSWKDQQHSETNPSTTTTTTDGSAAGHSFTTQGDQDKGAVADGDSILALQHATIVGQVVILQLTAQKHLRMHNRCRKHPNNLSTNQTSKEHND